MKNLALIFAAALLAAPAWGQWSARDHLVPEESIIAGSEFSPQYQMMVATVFADIYAPSIKARMIVEPSGGPEYAVGLKNEDGKYSILALRPSRGWIWGYIQLEWEENGLKSVRAANGNTKEELQAKQRNGIAQLKAALPKDYHHMPLLRCEIGVSTADAESILAAWKQTLLKTGFDPPQPESGISVAVMDGWQFHFSTGELSGATTSPAEKTEPFTLAGIGNTMFEYCEKKDAASLSKLNQQVNELLARLEKK